MKLTFASKELKINKYFIFGLYLVLVIIAKVVRYTVMKNVLVDSARGFSMLDQILYNENLHFQFSDENASMAFNNAEVIFKAINVFGLSTYVQYEILITILWNILILFIIARINKIEDSLVGIYIILTIAVMNIFNFTLSKEPIQMLYFVLMYLILSAKKISDKWKFVLSLGVVYLSTITFRSYYILMIMFSIVIAFLCNVLIIKKERVKFKHILCIIIMIAISYFIFLNIAKVVFPSSYNDLLKYRLKTHEANSEIHTLISGSRRNLVLFVMDYMLVVIRLMIPVELVAMGPKYIIFVIYQIMVTYFIINKIKNIKRISKIERYALYLYIGFILASATFEPDFGSWVRHEAVAFPILIVMIGLKNKQKEKNSMEGIDESINSRDTSCNNTR